MYKIVAMLAIILSGCSGYGRFVSAYSDARKSDVDYSGSSFVVYDRQDLKSLYIRNTLGSTVDVATKSVLSEGGIDDVRIFYRNAAQKFLVDSGRKGCSLSHGQEMMDNQYEFTYKCK